MSGSLLGGEFLSVSGNVTTRSGAGIRQFLDIGTGLPTAGNTHEIAQPVAPECRVVYVDNQGPGHDRQPGGGSKAGGPVPDLLGGAPLRTVLEMLITPVCSLTKAGRPRLRWGAQPGLPGQPRPPADQDLRVSSSASTAIAR